MRWHAYPENWAGTGGRPRTLIVYFPYEASLVRDVAQPIPNYISWPDERIIRDFSRLSALGVDGILVGIRPGDSVDRFRAERYERLFELVVRHSDWPRIAFWICPEPGVEARRCSLFVDWLTDMLVQYNVAYYQVEARALVVLSPLYTEWPVHHPALDLRFTARNRGQWNWQPRTPKQLAESESSDQLVVYAGYLESLREGHAQWAIPRRGGRTVVESFRNAVESAPGIICISSWNDYAEGSFVEPNTLDGSRVYDLLRREIRAFRTAAKR
ncbi:MAG: hypothetical protein K9N51_11430 [Candidatus Pacebacteria bacterium]|nr:hypothetical protein [Candidatus Paceibacterota bacterium]